MPTKLTTFQSQVYKIAKKIPKGKIMSYGEIAKMLKTSPRAVGQALKRNPYKSVPCHRVIMSSGKIGGYRGKKNSRKKIKLLKAEGIKIKGEKVKIRENDTPTYSNSSRTRRSWKVNST